MAYGLLSAIANAAKNFAVDDLGALGIFGRQKVAFGAEGAATDVSAANPLPVSDPLFGAATDAATTATDATPARAIGLFKGMVSLLGQILTALGVLHADNNAAPPANLPPLAASAGTNIGSVGVIGTVPVTVTGGQLGETLWTNDAGTFRIRVDAGGTVTFVDPATAAVDASFATSTGFRPAGDSATVDKTAYQVTTAATGIAVGDIVDHLVAIDRKTGGIITNLWLNSTQGTVLGSGPASTNIVAIGLGTQTVAQIVNGAAVSAANPLPVDTVVRATATDRGAVIGFAGAAITTTNGSNTITLTTPPAAGAFILGQQLAAAGVPAGATLATLASGALNAAGSTYTLSAAATITGSAVAATSIGPQQIMPANAARRGIQYQSQSAANFWANGTGAATADFHSLKIPANNYFETPPTHTGTGAVSVITDTPGAGLFVREY